MAKYKHKKKGVIIDAWPTIEILRGAETCLRELPECIVTAYDAGRITFLPDAVLIQDPDEQQKAKESDWILLDIEGNLFVLPPDIFIDYFDPYTPSAEIDNHLRSDTGANMKDQKSTLIGSSPSSKVSSTIIDAWNARHQVGDKITYIADDASLVITTITAPCEIVANCRCAKIAAAPHWCCLDRLITL